MIFKHMWLSSFFLGIVVLLLVAGSAAPVLASVCTLADHIRSANTNTAVGFCPAGASHDVITIADDLTLTEPLPPIRGTITIEGGGHSISGDGQFRIFDVDGGDLTVRNLTLENGRATDSTGGAIRLRNGARLTVEDSRFEANRAKRSGARGRVTMLRNFGGAIAADSGNVSLTVNRSIFTRNEADDIGGALYLQGSVSISNSAFTFNRASHAYGGAIHGEAGGIEVVNSAFRNNSTAAVGAVMTIDRANVTLTHVTMVDNTAQAGGDAIDKFGGVLRLRNSISANPGKAEDCRGRIDQNVGNLSLDGTCGHRRSGDLQLDRKTAPFEHLQLLDGSPALDAADPRFCPETDQIGAPRPQGGGCDAGAIESLDAIPAPTPAPVLCALPDQIVAANTDAPFRACPAGDGADTIYLIRDYRLSEPMPMITSEITIEGNGHAISGDNQFRIFDVQGGRLAINNLTLTEGYVPQNSNVGGALRVGEGEAAVSNSAFVSNYGFWGGAIGLAGEAKLTVDGVSFRDNRANDGGAIYLNQGDTVITNSSFQGNGADFIGGGIYISIDAGLELSNSSFISNRARHGGALAFKAPQSPAAPASVTLTHVTMVDNAAHAILIDDVIQRFSLRNSIIAGAISDSCVGPLLENAGNLIEDGSCSPMLSGDPMLGAVTGSPSYAPLQEGSPAIDAADRRFCLASDQAGNPRPQGGGCDIGAIEFRAAQPAQPDASQASTDCAVTTTHNLNVRDAPNGKRIGLLPAATTLAAVSRTAGWFNIEHQGESGWISADYVITQGGCG